MFIVAELYRNSEMNEQPSPAFANIFLVIMGLIAAFFAVKAYLENHTISLDNLDKFTLGYVEDSSNKIIVQVPKTVDSFESKQLFLDCIDTLIAVGFKKKEAKNKAKAIFRTHNPSSIQEFLNIALKRS